jgi:hypothetical protein
MRIKVEGGTANHGTNLCDTCTFAKKREGQHNERWLWCGSFRKYVTTNTYSCSEYQHQNTPDLWTLTQMAWILTGDIKSGKIKGFQPYKELSKEEKREINGTPGLDFI